MSGRLVLVGTPIGNLDDMAPRAAAAFASASVLACEDTRRTGRLLAHLSVTVPKLVRLDEHTEESVAPWLLSLVAGGDVVAVASDAGMPGLSDPGARIASMAREQGLIIEVVPGPFAAAVAIVGSGLLDPSGRFCFEGFLPRKPGERRAALAALAAEPRTLIFFEAPHRLAGSLADLAAAFGAERAGAVCRELTKTYEQVRRGPLGELAQWAQGDVRGEITLVVAGAPPAGPIDDPVELAARVARAEAGGLARKAAIAAVAAQAGVAKRVVYDAVIAGKQAH